MDKDSNTLKHNDLRNAKTPAPDRNRSPDASGIEQSDVLRALETRLSDPSYRMLFERTPVPGFLWDHQSLAILAVNDAAIQDYGYTREEFLGITINELWLTEDVPTLLNKLSQAHKLALPNQLHRHRRKDGSIIYVEVTANSLELDGRTAVLVFAIDVTERKRAEESLRQERDLLQSLIDHVPDNIYFKDGQLRYTRINMAQARMMGLRDPSMAIGKTDHEIFQAGYNWQNEVDEQRILATGEKVAGLRETIQTPEGKAIWISSTKVPFRNPDGDITGLVGISHDITEHKQAEEQLRYERDLLRALMENSPDMIYFKDLHSHFICISQIMAKRFGFACMEDAAGKSDFDVFGEEHARSAFEDEQEIIRTGKPVINKIEPETWKGTNEVTWALTTKMPLRTANGKIIGTFGISKDITVLKQTEQRLRDSNAIQNLILENSSLGIAFVRHRVFAWANGRLAEMLGLPLEQIQGASTRVIYPSDELFETLGRLAYPILASGKRSDNTLQLQRSDGSLFWCRFIGKALDPASPQGGSIWMFEDITQVKEAEQARQAMEIQLRQSQKLEAVGQLAAGIAHEINTPTQYVGDNTRFIEDSFKSIAKVFQAYSELLGAVKGNSVTPELLAAVEETLTAGDIAYLFEQIPAAIKETLEGVERITRIVRAMKEFSHPGGKDKAMANLNKAIETTTTVARNEWKYVADLELDLDPQLPAVPCFESEFNQCILNLVVNASHAIGDVVKTRGTKGTITIRTRHQGDFAEIQVRDTGTGIPEAIRAHVFEPFFTTKDVGKGTGQGLAIVYSNVVKKHGGTVHFETEVGQGTTFIIRLPLKLAISDEEPHNEAFPAPVDPKPVQSQ